MRQILLAVALVLGACQSAAPPAAPSLHVVLVRHAEKEADGTEDPALTDAGRQRAADLAARLVPERVVAVYSTDFRRTQETARPIAEAAGVAVTTEPIGDAGIEAFTARMAERVRSHLAVDGGTVVVVGHSNTIPNLAAALSGEPVAPMPETEYDRVIAVVLDSAGGQLTAPPAPR